MNRRDLLVVLLFVALGALFFAPVLVGGRTLIPFDNLFRFPPWNSFATQVGVAQPYNELASDLVLENYAWKKLLVESLRAKEIPLWNPYLFGGVPFLAAGQQSALYPFSILFYFLPLDRAFGIFVALQLAIAAIAMFVFARVLGLSRVAAIISALAFAFSGMMTVSITFPMVISAAAWLPAILACVELIVTARNSARQILFALIGALLIGIQFLAGHIEISMYVLIVTAFYTVWRAFSLPGWRGRVGIGVIIAAMTFIGIALAAIQIVPLYELVQNNFRSGSVTYQDVVGWAYPIRQIITFFIPDFFGNPTHHTYLDVFDFTTRPAPGGTIFWGIKNYVEAGSYVGILPLVLALIAMISRVTSHVSRLTSHISLFTVLAIISLLFTFGTPLYAILFFGVPGFNQLHSPFRWVFPYTLSVAALAGISAEIIQNSKFKIQNSPRQFRISDFEFMPIIIGIGILFVLAASWFWRDQSIAFADRIVHSSDLASQVFDNGRMFFSYEFRNVALFAIFVIGAGVAIRALQSARWRWVSVAILAADLFIIGMQFYPRADARLAEFTPPAVQFLQEDPSLYRITSYDNPDEKMFNANAGMFFGISDIRGYDSIIPKQYAELMGVLAPQDELLYNRIAAFYKPDPFDSPLLNLLNVKYVLTTRPLPNAGYTLVYDKEIQIYRNDRVLPRAFMVPRARVITDRAALLNTMKQLDPTRGVLIEQQPESNIDATCALKPVSIEKYALTEVIVKSEQDCAGWLVLSDSYFPGWIAQIDGQDASLYRADYNFRAVIVPAGAHTIRFRYSPVSFRVGGIASFVGAMMVLLGFAYLAWRRFYREETTSQIQVVAKNSLLPMATSLLMKLIDLAFAFLSFRVLGPTGTGRYGWAILIWSLTDTITDFGLGLLLTREMSRDRTRANRYLTNGTILRVLLWLASILPVALVTYVYLQFFNLSTDSAFAIGLLMISMLPGTLAASLASLFYAYERFEYRIAVDMTTRLLSVTLGVIALVLGYGIIGLATVSIITNIFQLTVFYWLVRTTLFAPRLELDRPMIRWMFFESYPLMLNNLFAKVFFRIDGLILQAIRGDTELGYYQTAYKFIDALNIIPSNFTIAIFPALSRLASSAKDAMLRAYVLSLKILLWIALPITVGTIFISHELIGFIGGDAYLPHSAIALQVLIWFLPFSFMNSVTHYVLIALGQQRFLTKAFIIGVVFNLAANVVAIPALGYVGAALTTILSEMVLLAPFYYSVRKNLATIPFLSLAWRPALASGVMGVALWAMIPLVGVVLAIPVAGIVYGIVLIALGALGEDEKFLLRKLIPEKFHRLARIAQ
ncbi:MAG: oligosaccharide flippase family protein [Chloroflexi bacterium]|nr:oligosaccharide flippase family protein [Chloroflexota bacterium]